MVQVDQSCMDGYLAEQKAIEDEIARIERERIAAEEAAAAEEER